MALFVFGLGLLVNFETLQTNHNAKAQISALANHSGSSDVPSQQKLTTNAIKNYQVAPNLPKYLIISKLSIYARILQVGVTNTGALGTPPDIYDTAWYTGSATPGEPASDGAVLIDGHVHGPTLPGVFMNIKSLVPGDSIQIVKGDNQTYTYTVNKVMTVPVNQVNMKQLLTSYQPSSQGLNLITCGGPFDKRTWQYTKRVEVFTSLSQSI
jgi:sortase (surface protein transpeptidase)